MQLNEISVMNLVILICSQLHEWGGLQREIQIFTGWSALGLAYICRQHLKSFSANIEKDFHESMFYITYPIDY